jgi:hypothetical protein
MNITNYNCYMKMLAQGVPQDPFNIKTLPAPNGNLDILEDLKQYSYLTYGRRRDEVEAEIMEKYKKKPAPTPPAMPANFGL